MEDDDEFGDLYTDVLRPLMTPSFQSQAQQPLQPQSQSPPRPEEIPKVASGSATSYHGRSIDLNVTSDDEVGGERNLFGAPNSRPAPKDQTLASTTTSSSAQLHLQPDSRNFDLNEEFGLESGNSEGFVGSDSQARVLGAADGNVKLPENALGSPGFMDAEPEDDVTIKEGDKKDDFLVKDENLVDKTKAVDNFSVGEGGGANREMGLDTTIPGLSIPGISGGVESRANANFDDDWDSDSEDDLQIVLNDSHHGPMGAERMGGGGIGDEEDDEDDEDGEALVIVADNDDPGHQPMIMEEQEWGGEEGGTGADGEKKELSESGKVNGMGGAVVAAPKIGYSSHGYHHPYHSQFKYVRPGASPMPGAAPVGPGGSVQVRPPVGMVPVAGRGRGDWRPPGIKGSPAMQKGFYPGYGMPVWGTGTSGRGLEFTLPSHKTIFEVDIDGFEEKPWRHQGVDISDFFNFGLTEESWKDYCKQLEQLRLETTMQSKIRVYESGRTVQEYDPDLPPELAAAAGIQEIPSENSKLGKTDAGQDDLTRGTVRMRPPLPTGRAIQVETGYGERLPSIDTRKPRISDLDVIIEIVCQDSLDDDTNRGDKTADQAETERENLRDGDDLDEAQEDTQHLDHSPHAYNSRKREVGRKVPFVHNNVAEGDDTLPSISEAPAEYHSDSREQTPVNNPERSLAASYDDRQAKGRAHSRSPMATNKERMTKKQSPDKKESSIESIHSKSSPLPSSPVSVGISAEAKDSMTDEIVRMETGSDKVKEELVLNAKTENDSLTDETRNHASKKQKLSSEFEPSLPQEVDEQEDSKAARSSENSKARSGSSNYRKIQDVVEDEEVQGGRATHRDNIKRSVGRDDDSIRRKVRNDRQENERHHGAVKGREDLYQHKGWDSYTGHSSRVKSETTELRRGIDTAEGAYQRRDEDIHGRRTRAEDTRKREHRDETGSGQRSKAREIERHEKDEHHQLRKQLDNGSWRGSYDKDTGTRHRDRDDSVKIRNENLDDLSNKRRKEEAHLMREHPDKEESLHAHRESSSRRKRERDDVPDQRRRDDQLKARNDDQHIARHKEDGLFQRERGDRQRERDEWYRLKQMNQEVPPKKDKEAARGRTRSGRAAEDKARGGQSRGKDDHRSSDKEFHPKDGGRQHESLNRRDRAENVSLSQQRGREDFYAHGNLLNNEERRARHERATTREDHAANASDNYKVHENKHREIPRKGKESEFIDGDSLPYPKKHQDETSGHAGDMVRLKGRVEHGSSENEIHVNNPTTRKPRDEASSDDELSESRRGRSKIERWTSQKERDFGINTKSPSSMKIRQIESYNSSRGASVASKLNDEASKTVDDKQQHPINEKDAGGLEMNYLDTVEKLKKRSERFKLPMPSEKEATAIKKMENEPLPSGQSENHSDFEIKAERPARKRRWTGN